ncbi:hypothetical protein MD484_g7298, partial [Candolleomyces efflorescens]
MLKFNKDSFGDQFMDMKTIAKLISKFLATAYKSIAVPAVHVDNKSDLAPEDKASLPFVTHMSEEGAPFRFLPEAGGKFYLVTGFFIFS